MEMIYLTAAIYGSSNLFSCPDEHMNKNKPSLSTVFKFLLPNYVKFLNTVLYIPQKQLELNTFVSHLGL